MSLVGPAQTVTTGFARAAGSFREPYLEMRIHPRLRYPMRRSTLMVDWIKGLGSSRWDPSTEAWNVYGLNSLTPAAALADAGIELHWDDRSAELGQLASIDKLTWPIAKLHSNGSPVMVRHRLAGFETHQATAGPRGGLGS